MTARVDIGAMRHRVTLEAAVDSPGPGGVAARIWTELGRAWAEIRPGSSRTGMEEARRTTETTVVIRMRYRDGLSGAGRIVKGARTFIVLGVRDVEEAHRILEFTCREDTAR
jgi:SPP1 family predicted phage head-tail adaptor